MLGKLIKYEMKATVRTFWLIYAAVLGLAVLNRFFYAFDLDALTSYEGFGWIPGLIIGLFTMIYVLMIIAMFVTVMIVVITRFYKNLYTDEGYLSFTLPVKPWQHIVAKTFSAAVWMFASTIVMFLSIAIMLSHAEVMEVFRIGITEIQKELLRENITLLPFAAEFIVSFLLGCIGYALPIYACIAIGQQWKKHRILGAFCAYLGINFLTQVISGIMGGAMSVSFVRAMEDYGAYSSQFYMDYFMNFMHTAMIVSIGISIVLSAVYFLICNYLMGKKLDLE